MVKLALPTESYWLDLPNKVRVYVRPLTTVIYETARIKASNLISNLLKESDDITLAGGVIKGLDLKDEDSVMGVSQYLFVQALALSAIEKWEGVYTQDDKNAEVSVETVRILMGFHEIASEFIEKYTQSYIELVSEGNV